jgi:light-regulated signal transduction histidine kinase (bacteriophytochrome)
MSLPPDVNDHSDWTVIYNDDNGKKQDQMSHNRQTLARTLSIPKTMCILSDTKTEISTVAELPSPKLKLPQLGHDSAERIFPVRSALSFDSTPSSAQPTPSIEKLETPISPFSDTWTGNFGNENANFQPTIAAVKESIGQEALKRPDSLAKLHKSSNCETGYSSASKKQDQEDEHSLDDPTIPHTSKDNIPSANILRQLQNTVESGGDVLGAYRPTNGLQYSKQDEEAIAIQSFGALIVLAELNGKFEVQIASNNSSKIIGYSPDELFELDSFCDILSSSHIDTFLDHVNFVLDDQYEVVEHGPEIFLMTFFLRERLSQSVWCTMHTSKAYKSYVICEIQPTMASGSITKATQRVQQLERHAQTSEASCTDLAPHGDPRNLATPKEDGRSTEINVTDSSEALNAIPRILQQLAKSQTVETLVQSTVVTLQKLTQFSRTTIFHFEDDCNGTVVADAFDSSLGLTSFTGTSFPESTFPEPLRKRYMRNTVCLSYARTNHSAELVYRASTNKHALDMSHTYLSAAPTSLKPSSGPPVKACLSIGINVSGKLWGLISCQSYETDKTLHPIVQKVCWFVAEAASNNIQRLSSTIPIALKEPHIFSNNKNRPQAANTPSSDLLSLFGADYAAASIMGESKILGRPVDSQEVLAVLEYMKAKEIDTVLSSTNITSDFQDLNYYRGFHCISGLLYVPLSVDGHDFIMFFRADLGCNTPRDYENESIWSAAEFEKASSLSLLYRTFSEIWQEKEAAMQNNQLMRLLLANSAHEFRTPLNAIINYLEIALDGSLDQETRDHISRSHSASKSLVYIINDLLDLTNAENGQRLIKDEIFNLPETLTEATDIFWEEARQKHVDLQVVQHAALPPVLGDQRRVRQVITNLISNAIQHTASGALTIESCVVPEDVDPDHISVEVAIHDTGSGMSQETVETLFCELEQVSNKGYMKTPKSYGCTPSGTQVEIESVLGLGLALVARIVRNMNGQLSLRSEEGKGSCFKIRLKFPLPAEKSDDQATSFTSASSQPRQKEEKEEETSKSCTINQKDGIPCECGTTPEFTGGSVLDVDVCLKTGESKKFSLSRPELETSKAPQELHRKSSPLPTPPHSPEVSKPPATASPGNKTQSLDQNNSTMDATLHVLVAEDDPINSTILRKRLEKFGHTIDMTANGKECASVYKSNPKLYSAILMDLQVNFSSAPF